MVIYYCITILANIAAIPIFYEYIYISALSIVPLFLIALTIFQALLFKNEKVENGFRTAYGSNLTADEENKLLCSGSSFLFATIPWMIPFVLFFPAIVKVLSILVYIIGLVGGLILYRIKNKGKIVNRIDAEEKRASRARKERAIWKMEITLLPRFGGASLLCPQKQCLSGKIDRLSGRTNQRLPCVKGADAEGG